MSETPFIKFYASDFLAGTSGLSPAERGVYITLLCLIYEADGPIPRDDARLSRRCGAPKAAFVRTLDSLIAEGKILEYGGMISNKRAEKAIVDRANRVEKSTIAAHQRWNAQEEKTEENQGPVYANASPKQCLEVCQPEPEPEPEPDIREEPPLVPPPKKSRRKPEVELPEGWVPSDKNIQDALEKGLTEQEIEHEANQFRDYNHSKQNRYRDWDAAWRTWIGRSSEFRRNRSMAGATNAQGYGQSSSIASIVARRRADGKV